MLEVEATVKETNEKYKVLITENAGVMSQEEIEKRFIELADLKIHPRDQIENRTVIAQADRLYEQSLGDVRHFLAQQIAQFQATLETQDPDLIRHARSHLRELLQQIEGESFL